MSLFTSFLTLLCVGEAHGPEVFGGARRDKSSLVSTGLHPRLQLLLTQIHAAVVLNKYKN